MMTMRYGIAAVALTALVAVPAFAQTSTQTMPDRSSTMSKSTSDKVSSADKKFVSKAIEANLAEVQMGQLAQQKGQSESVKSLGKMLTDDHGKNNEQAKSLAQSLGVTAPTAPTKSQKKEYDRMSQLSGDKFDREFTEHMVKDHKKDISEFKKETKSKNSQVAGYANATLPDLQRHLNMAEQAQASVKGGSKQNAQVPSSSSMSTRTPSSSGMPSSGMNTTTGGANAPAPRQ